IDYVVGDIYDMNLNKYAGYFDVLYLEGGILHYFNDIHKFMDILFTILKKDGRMVLSDFHPFKRCVSNEPNYELMYFDENQQMHKGDLAYKSFFNEQEQQELPDVSLRYYTLSEIINSVINSGVKIQKVDEHRGGNNEKIPGEFTILANK